MSYYVVCWRAGFPAAPAVFIVLHADCRVFLCLFGQLPPFRAKYGILSIVDKVYYGMIGLIIVFGDI